MQRREEIGIVLSVIVRAGKMQPLLLCRLQQVSWELQQSGEVRVQ